MICPKCYGKMDKNTGVCKSCGFSVHDLAGATNFKAKQAFREKKKDDVLYTSILPNDVSKKKLLLYGGLLGLVGVQNFYVGKTFKGVYQAITFGLMVIYLILNAIFPFSYYVLQFGSIMFMLLGISTLIWIIDFGSICFNRFKVPVYKEEYSFKRKWWARKL